MISKECFVNLIDYVKKYNNALNELPDWVGFDNFPFSQMCCDILDIFEIEMELSEENGGRGLIFTWCYDYNFGTKYRYVGYRQDKNGCMHRLDVPEPGCLIAVDGVKYAPATAEELYDLLIKLFVNK